MSSDTLAEQSFVNGFTITQQPPKRETWKAAVAVAFSHAPNDTHPHVERFRSSDLARAARPEPRARRPRAAARYPRRRASGARRRTLRVDARLPRPPCLPDVRTAGPRAPPAGPAPPSRGDLRSW